MAFICDRYGHRFRKADTIAANGNHGQQSFLVSEVPVRDVSRDATAGAHFAQGNCLWAASVEELGGSIEQGEAGLGRRFLAADHG